MKKHLQKSILIPTLLFFMMAHSVKGQWLQTSGPAGGPVQSMVTDGSNLFAGSNGGGVFLSTDNANSWSPVNNGLKNLYVKALASSGSTIVAGTLAGVFITSNNGNSWSQMNNGLGADTNIRTVAIN